MGDGVENITTSSKIVVCTYKAQRTYLCRYILHTFNSTYTLYSFCFNLRSTAVKYGAQKMYYKKTRRVSVNVY